MALAESGPAAPELLAQVRKLRDELDEEQRDRQLLAALDKAWLAQMETDSQSQRVCVRGGHSVLASGVRGLWHKVRRTTVDQAAQMIRSRSGTVTVAAYWRR